VKWFQIYKKYDSKKANENRNIYVKRNLINRDDNLRSFRMLKVTTRYLEKGFRYFLHKSNIMRNVSAKKLYITVFVNCLLDQIKKG
jgi:hypothetical protein